MQRGQKRGKNGDGDKFEFRRRGNTGTGNNLNFGDGEKRGREQIRIPRTGKNGDGNNPNSGDGENGEFPENFRGRGGNQIKIDIKYFGDRDKIKFRGRRKNQIPGTGTGTGTGTPSPSPESPSPSPLQPYFIGYLLVDTGNLCTSCLLHICPRIQVPQCCLHCSRWQLLILLMYDTSPLPPWVQLIDLLGHICVVVPGIHCPFAR